MNILAYFIYLPVTVYITVVVGHRLYSDGAYFIRDLFPTQRLLADQINKFLLIGYYLLNLGYVAISLTFWKEVSTLLQVAEELSIRLGLIVLTLGIIHYLNMVVLAIVSFSKTSLTLKNPLS